MIVISVTLEDIRNGKQGNGYSCPVALAIKRAGFINATVGLSSTDINGRLIKLPKLASEFVRAFDLRGRCVEPITFPLFTGGR